MTFSSHAAVILVVALFAAQRRSGSSPVSFSMRSLPRPYWS